MMENVSWVEQGLLKLTDCVTIVLNLSYFYFLLNPSTTKTPDDTPRTSPTWYTGENMFLTILSVATKFSLEFLSWN